MKQRSKAKPDSGEVWTIDLNPMLGHAQDGRRSCLIISNDQLNYRPADLVIVLPITTRDKGIPSHIAIDPPEGGLSRKSFVKVEDVRSVSIKRLGSKLGMVTRETLDQVEEIFEYLLF